MAIHVETLKALQQEISEKGAKLIAVSKLHSKESIQQAWAAGQTVFGENYVQELVEKQPLLPDQLEWHFIGHLQSNKVKFIAPFIAMIHTVDSIKLLTEINKQAAKANRTIPCLLQVHLAQEETKFGFSEEEVVELLTRGDLEKFKHVVVAGFMGMASLTDDQNLIRNEFHRLKVLRDHWQTRYPSLLELSMGMSGDYRIALEEGSTMVRIGSAIFGERTKT